MALCAVECSMVFQGPSPFSSAPIGPQTYSIDCPSEPIRELGCAIPAGVPNGTHRGHLSLVSKVLCEIAVPSRQTADRDGLRPAAQPLMLAMPNSQRNTEGLYLARPYVQ